MEPRRVNLTLSVPWADRAEDIDLAVVDSGFFLVQRASSAAASRPATRCIAAGWPGEFELLVPVEGLRVFVLGHRVALELGGGSWLGVDKFSARERRANVDLIVVHDADGPHGEDSVEFMDVLMPLAMPEGNLQLRAAPFSHEPRSAVRSYVCPTALLIAGWLRHHFCYLPQHANTSRCRVLEIGAGTGICGLVAAAHGAEVVLTDCDPPTLELLRENVADFRRRAEYILEPVQPATLTVSKLDVSSEAEVEAIADERGHSFDVVLCSGVMSDRSSLKPLFAAADLLLRRASVRDVALVFSIDLGRCDIESVQLEGHLHDLVLKDCTKEMRSWAVCPPPDLVLPTPNKNHCLLVGTRPPSGDGGNGEACRVGTTVASPGVAGAGQRRPWVSAGEDEWYRRSAAYWDQSEASISGVLGGRPETSSCDLQGSAAFVDAVACQMVCGGSSAETKCGVALDCGAGIGRVAEGLLANRYAIVDLLEPCHGLLDEARRRLEGLAWTRHFIEAPLQHFPRLYGPYDAIWIQWVLLYLTDLDLVAFLKHAMASLRRPDGFIAIKENVMLNESRGVVDQRDSSITRSDSRFRELFAEAGLTILVAHEQQNWPGNLMPVMMYALVVD